MTHWLVRFPDATEETVEADTWKVNAQADEPLLLFTSSDTHREVAVYVARHVRSWRPLPPEDDA